ncbi:MAG TPA: 23S rRNA (guanosine(2251)-2'-O)-methyltransferase RlmB [Rhodocyclaceae bacterium]|nr:23S rRNA (guanosine(2251)-2'-O)-methyltransferase RlmB [Rhodocyclaceae bacterium]
MSSPKVIFGFHAVGVRIKTAPKSVLEVMFDTSRRDARMKQFIARAQEAGVRLVEADGLRLAKLSGSHGHQGVVARVEPIAQVRSLDELLEGLEEAGTVPLLLVLDGVTDPHNLGACLRSADAAGALAVIVPKDKSATLTPVVRKVACGAAEVIPLVAVTNLARTLEKLQQRGLWVVGTAGEAEVSIYDQDLTGPTILIMGAEGKGMRRLTREHCDYLVNLPMAGSVSSLNVSVATGVCLFEAQRQRGAKAKAAAKKP